MPRYIIQMRLIKLPGSDAEPDRWSSATSIMTEAEVSVPFDAEEDDISLHSSQAYLDAITSAIARLANADRAES